MYILVTLQRGEIFNSHYTPEVLTRLGTYGNVIYNETSKPFTAAMLAEAVAGVDVCFTHWGCPTFTPKVLENADRLRLITHCAGSVADLCTREVFDRGIHVCSANDVLADYVAEGVLAYFMSALRLVPELDRRMKSGEQWPQPISRINSLYGKRISLIGLGAVGIKLISLLEPFGVNISIYDPYIKTAPADGVTLCGLDEALSTGDIVSVHASLTAETERMLGARELGLIKEGALLVNTARGKIIDEAALIELLKKGKHMAVLDVFEKEPLPVDSELRQLPNVILIPHLCGHTAKHNMALAMLDELERFSTSEPFRYEISPERYEKMTRQV